MSEFMEKVLELKRAYTTYMEMERDEEYYPGARMRTFKEAKMRFLKACDELCKTPIPDKLYEGEDK